MQRKPTYRIVASSLNRQGDLIVEDDRGGRRLFIGSTGVMSNGLLHGDFISAMFRRQRWGMHDDQHRYSFDDLRAVFGGHAAETSMTRHLAHAAGVH